MSFLGCRWTRRPAEGEVRNALAGGVEEEVGKEIRGEAWGAGRAALVSGSGVPPGGVSAEDYGNWRGCRADLKWRGSA